MRETTSAAVHASRTVSPLKRRAIRGLVIGLSAAALMAFLGAMQTGDVPIGQRLAYWVAVIVPGSMFGLAITALVKGWGRLADHFWLEMALVALLISLPHSFVVIVATAIFFQLDSITPITVLQFWTAVLVFSLALTAINYLALAREQRGAAALPLPAPVADPGPPPAPATAPAAADAPPPTAPAAAGAPQPMAAMPPVLAGKLPGRFRHARLIAIEAEDHYVRIHTDAGSALLLMRLSDACAMVADVAGRQVHRSWWVASDAITARRVVDGRMWLALAGSLEVPVSRRIQRAMKAGAG